MKYNIVLPFFFLSIKSSFSRESEFPHRVFEREISATTSPTSPTAECVNILEPDEGDTSLKVILSEVDLIPCDYNPVISPTEGSSDKVEVSFLILNIRDIDEKNQDYTLEVNFYMYWQDQRLRKIRTPEGSKYIAIDPKVLPKMWSPDIIIDNVKDVSQPALFSKPFSLRMYNDSTIRYSSRMTIKMACNMDFQYYPADTQRCTICLRSLEYSRVNLTWYSNAETEAVRIAKIPTIMSSYDVKLAEIKNIEKGIIRKKDKPFRVVTFDVHFKRNLNYHLLQTFFPSSIFIVISWLAFLVPPENVSARMTLCMSTLLTIMTMFAAVRQNTPNESYAKALDVWMLACISFVFVSLVEYTILLKLISIKVKIKKSDDLENEPPRPLSHWKGFNLRNLNFDVLKRKTEEEDNPNIATISHGSHTPSGGIELTTQEVLRPKYRDRNQGSIQGSNTNDGDDQGCISRSSPSSEHDQINVDTTTPQTGIKASISSRHNDPDKYKKIAVAIERVATIVIPSAFVLFNFVFWPTLLIQSGHFAN